MHFSNTFQTTSSGVRKQQQHNRTETVLKYAERLAGQAGRGMWSSNIIIGINCLPVSLCQGERTLPQKQDHSYFIDALYRLIFACGRTVRQFYFVWLQLNILFYFSQASFYHSVVKTSRVFLLQLFFLSGFEL